MQINSNKKYNQIPVKLNSVEIKFDLPCVRSIRHQSNLCKTWFTLIAVVRWLHFRMDCITSLFLTVVTAIAVMTSQHAGEKTCVGLVVGNCMQLKWTNDMGGTTIVTSSRKF